MADNLQATPRNQLLGLLSDAMYGGLDWMKDPQRTQQMQGLAGLLESTGIPKTTERMAYGEPLTNIGRANVPLLKPETAEALMNVAPFAPAVGRLTSRAVRATEGLPVGMSIKPIENIYHGTTSKAAKEIEKSGFDLTKSADGTVWFTSNPNIGEVAASGKGGIVQRSIDTSKMKLGGWEDADKYSIDELINMGFDGLKLTEDGASTYQIFNVDKLSKPLQKAVEQSPYHQQAALDLAQQRAALPVEQGGLGLLENNTPEMRAQAMGFDTPVYHATDIDFTAIRPSVKGKYGAGVYTATSPKYAEIYAQGENARTLPLMARGKIASDDERIAIADQMLEQYRTNQSMSVPLWKEKTKEELANRGYTGVGIGKERLMFNPEDLRSRFAAFDPFRKDVATATAMGVALPDLLAAEPTPEELQRRQSAGLLFP